jgi:hypothetical protein
VNASLSADHRVTDSHRASAFLAVVDRLLQKLTSYETGRDQRRGAAPSPTSPRGRPGHASIQHGPADQLDIDSMDSLNLAIGIREQLHVDISEADWARLYTLDEVIDNVVEKTAA